MQEGHSDQTSAAEHVKEVGHLRLHFSFLLLVSEALGITWIRFVGNMFFRASQSVDMRRNVNWDILQKVYYPTSGIQRLLEFNFDVPYLEGVCI